MSAPKCGSCGNDGSDGGLYLTIDARYNPATGMWTLQQREDDGGMEIDCAACDERTGAVGREESGFPYDMEVPTV